MCVTGHDKFFGQDFADQHLSACDVFICTPKPLPHAACVFLNGRACMEDQHCNSRTANSVSPSPATTQVHIRGYREQIAVTAAGRNNKELRRDQGKHISNKASVTFSKI